MKRCPVLLLAFLFFAAGLHAQLPELIPYRKGHLWGYADSTKKIVIPCTLQDAQLFTGDSARVQQDGQWGYVQKNGGFRPDPPPKTDSITWIGNPPLSSLSTSWPPTILSPSVYTVTLTWNWNCNGPCPAYNDKKGLYGYKNDSGKLVIPYRYVEAGFFGNGLAAVRLNDSVQGYINTSGTFVKKFPAGYDLGNFENGLAIVRTGLYAGLLNTGGQWVLPPLVRELERHGKIFIAGEDGYYLLLNRYGKMIGSRVYESHLDCDNGLLLLGSGGLYGFADSNGKAVTPVQYQHARKFSSGLAPVSLDGENWGFINTRGKMVIPLKYSDPGEGFVRNNLCRIGQLGYIDIYGKEYWED